MPAPTGLLFVDSFDHYDDSPTMQEKWTIACSAPSFVTGRSGSGQALELSNATGAPMLNFGYSYPTIYIGQAYKTASFSNFIFKGVDFGFLNYWQLNHLGDGRLNFFVSSADSGPLGSFVMSLNTYYFIEIKVAITANLYTYDVRINNISIGSGALASSTLGIPSPGTSSFQIIPPGGGLSCTIDDLYVTDDEFLGDTAWKCIFPNAAGDATDWTPNPAVANYINVQEHSPDGFTSYNQADNLNDQDLYNMDNIGAFTVKGIHALNSVTKSASGVSSLKGSIKTNATLGQEDEFYPSFGSWLYQRKPYRKNPVTGIDWTAAEINAIQRGAIRIS